MSPRVKAMALIVAVLIICISPIPPFGEAILLRTAPRTAPPDNDLVEERELKVRTPTTLAALKPLLIPQTTPGCFD
jgi:hypothetical protein